MRKENIIYYGSMSDSHIIYDADPGVRRGKGYAVAKRVSVQLQQDQIPTSCSGAYCEKD